MTLELKSSAAISSEGSPIDRKTRSHNKPAHDMDEVRAGAAKGRSTSQYSTLPCGHSFCSGGGGPSGTMVGCHTILCSLIFCMQSFAFIVICLFSLTPPQFSGSALSFQAVLLNACIIRNWQDSRRQPWYSSSWRWPARASTRIIRVTLMNQKQPVHVWTRLILMTLIPVNSEGDPLYAWNSIDPSISISVKQVLSCNKS